MSKTITAAFLLRSAGWVLIAALALYAGRGALAATPTAAYTELNKPWTVDPGGKIEVVEFFWYGCPHCYSLEPTVQSWLGALPKDVEFRRIPAPPNESWKAAARTYYALDALGVLTRLHKPLFDAVQLDHLRLTNTQQVDDWLTRQNVDVARFHAAENSFSVETKLKRAAQLFDQSEAGGVPAMVVNGRYLVELSKSTTPQKIS